MSILLTRTNKHLGESPGVFLDVPYQGLVCELPFTVTWEDEEVEEVSIIVETSDVETWGGWKGHPVMLNGIEIGRVQDVNNLDGPKETTAFKVKKKTFPNAFNKGAKNRLSISVNKKNTTQAGFLDDFILLAIRTDGFAGAIGW